MLQRSISRLLLRLTAKTQEKFVILPNYTMTLDDAKQFAGQQTQAEVLQEWSGELDAVHATTGYYSLTYHAASGWGTGTPDHAWNVARELIRKAKSMPGVKIMTNQQLADYCISNPEEFRIHPGNNSR
jgi:hypothetical protein